MIATQAATLASPTLNSLWKCAAMPACSVVLTAGEQIAGLVDDAGERAARIRGRKLIEMGRNDTPRALDHELHQKSSNGEQNGAAGEGPKRHDRQ
jgi:hypothetical protein